MYQIKKLFPWYPSPWDTHTRIRHFRRLEDTRPIPVQYIMQSRPALASGLGSSTTHRTTPTLTPHRAHEVTTQWPPPSSQYSSVAHLVTPP